MLIHESGSPVSLPTERPATRLYVVRLATGLYRPIHATLPDTPAIVDYRTALKIQAGHPGSEIVAYSA